MKKITESDWLASDFFNSSHDSPGDKWFDRGMWCFVGSALSAMFMAVLADSGLIPGAFFFLMFVIIPLSAMIPELGKLHALDGIKSPRYYDYSSVNLRARGKEYLSLSNADRTLYPSDILKVLADPDLTNDQKVALDDKMKTIYNGIVERNRQRAIVSRREVPIDHVLERLDDAARGVEIDIETFKEFSDKD